MLALPPALLAVLGTVAYVFEAVDPTVKQTVSDRVLELAGTFLTPSTVEDIVRPTVDRVVEQGSGGLAAISFAVSLFAASRATAVVMEVMRITFEEKPRSALARRLRAVGYTFALVAGLVLVLPALAVGPRVVQSVTGWVGSPEVAEEVVSILYWPVVALAGTALLTMFFRLVLPRDGSWRQDVPGAICAVMLWILGGLALRVYADWSFDPASVFGPLAAPVVLLLWFYVSGFALLLGVELNSQLQPGGRRRKDGSDPRSPRHDRVAKENGD